MGMRLKFRLWFLVAARFGEKHLLTFKFQVSSSLKREDSIALKIQDDSHISVNTLVCKNRIHTKQKGDFTGKLVGVFRDPQGGRAA